MYRAKALGRNGFQCFSSEMASGGTNRLEMESLLRRAWGNREFMLYYQPQFDRFDNMIALEALLRWTHPKLGAVPPFGSQYHIDTIVDDGLADDEYIVFDSNTHDCAVSMRFADYAKVEHPRVAHITT